MAGGDNGSLDSLHSSLPEANFYREVSSSPPPEIEGGTGADSGCSGNGKISSPHELVFKSLA